MSGYLNSGCLYSGILLKGLLSRPLSKQGTLFWQKNRQNMQINCCHLGVSSDSGSVTLSSSTEMSSPFCSN